MDQYRQARVVGVALACAMFSGTALAQGSETRGQSVEALQQELAALRVKVQRLELEAQVAKLRERARQLEAAKTNAVSRPGNPSSVTVAAPVDVRPGALAAWAADMPVKSLPQSPPAVSRYSWTGVYFGGNIGGGWASHDFRHAPSDPVIAAGLSQFVSASARADLSRASFVGGGQIGLNWQFAPHVVVGIEADANWGAFSKSRAISIINGPAARIVPLNNPPTMNEATMDFFTTLRGRVGYAENNWLLFGTAGLAMTKIKSQTNFSVQTAPFFVEISRSAGAVSKTRLGLAVGGGVEYLFGPNWSAKAEYQYIDFGTLTYDLAPFVDTMSVQTRLHILRAGVNFRL